MVHDKYKDLSVDFSGTQKGHDSFKQRTSSTEYADVDLASGYPIDMIWTTLDGRRIAIPNLSNSHLLNILAYVRRKSETYRMRVAVSIVVSGISFRMTRGFDEMLRSLDIEDKIISREVMKSVDKLMEMDFDEFLRQYMPIYGKLYQEAYKRKILIEVDKSKVTYVQN